MGRDPNPRLAQIHRSYTVDEIARRWGVHRNTVRNWIKLGLRTLDERRPQLIHGRDLLAFLSDRRRKRRRPCGPGEVYCVRCRLPRRPAGGTAVYSPLAPGTGNLVGLCPDCGCRIFRRVSLARLGIAGGDLAITEAEPLRHISEGG